MAPRPESPEVHAFFTPNKKRLQGTTGNSDEETRISTSAPSRRRSADSSVAGEDWAGSSSIRSIHRQSRKTTTVTWSDLRSVESSELDSRNRQLDEKVRIAEALLANKEAQVFETQRHLGHLKSRLETMIGTNEHAERVVRRNTELEALIARIQDEHDAKMREMAALVARLKSSVSDEQRALELATATSVTTLRAASSNQAELIMLRDRVTELEASQAQEVNSFSKKLFLAESRLAEAELAKKHAEDKMIREVQLLRDNLDHKVDQLKQFTDTNSHAAALLARNTHLERSLMIQYQESQNELTKLQQKLSSAESERERALLTSAERKERILVLELAASALKSDREELSATIRNLEHLEMELADVKSSCTALTVARDTLQAKLELENARNAEAIARKDRQLETFKDIQDHVDMVLKRNKELEQCMADVSRQREDELGVKERQILSLRTDLNSRDRSLMGAQREIEQLRQANERLAREHRGAASTELEAAKLAQSTTANECQRLRVSLAEVESALASFKLGAEENKQRLAESNRRQLEADRHELELKIRSELLSVIRADEKTSHNEEIVLRQKIADLEASMASLAESQAEQIQLFSRQRLEEMQALQQKYEEMIRATDADKNRQMREYSTKKEVEIEDIKRELESCRQVHESDLRKLRISCENRIRDKTSLYETEIQTMTTRLESLETAKNAAVDDIKRVARAEASAQIQKLQAESQEKLRNQIEDDRKQTVVAFEQKDKEMAELRMTLEVRFRNALNAHQNDMRTIEELHIKEKQRMSELYKSSLASVETHSQKLLQNTVDMKNAEIAKMRATVESLEASITPRAGEIAELDRLKSSLALSESTRRSLEESITEERRRYTLELHKRDKQAETLMDNSNRLEILLRRNSEIERLLAEKSEAVHAALQSRDKMVSELSESINAQKTAETRRKTAAAAMERRLRADLEAAQIRGVVAPSSCGHQCEAAKIERLNLKSAIVRLEEQLQRERDADTWRANEINQQMELITSTNTQADRLLKMNEALENEIDSIRRQRDTAVQKEGDIDELRAERDAQSQRVQQILSKFADDEAAVLVEQSKVRELQLKLAQADNSESVKQALEKELGSKIAELAASKGRLEDERKLLQSQLDTERERLASMAEQREIQLVAVREANAQAESTMRRNAQLEAITDELQTRLAEIQKMGENNARAHQARWAEETSAWNAERERLAKQITEEVTTRYEEDIESNYRTEIDVLNAMNAELKKRVSELDVTVHQLQFELESSAITNPNLVDAIDRLVQLERLVAQMQDERDRTVEKVQSQMRKVLQQKLELDAELDGIRGSVADKERSILTLNERLERLVREKEDVQRTLGDVNDKLKLTVDRVQLGEDDVKLVESLRTLEDRNANLEGVVASLRRTISEQQNTLTSLVERAVEAQNQNGHLSRMATELGNIQNQCHPDPVLIHNVITKTKEVQRLTHISSSGVPADICLKLSSLEAQCASKESTLEMAKQQQATLVAEAESLRRRLSEKMEATGTEAWRKEMSRLNEEEIKSLKSRLTQLGEHILSAKTTHRFETGLETPRVESRHLGSVIETTPDHTIVSITPNRESVPSGSQKRRTASGSSSPAASDRIPSLPDNIITSKRHKGNSQ